MTRTRGIGIAGVVTALLVFVGSASRTRPLASRDSTSVHTTHILMAVALAVVVALVVFLAIDSHRPGSNSRRRWAVGDVVLALLLVAALTAGSFGLGQSFHPSRASQERGVRCSTYEQAHGRAASNCYGPAGPVAKQTKHQPKHHSRTSWLGIGAIVALLLSGCALLVFDRRKRISPASEAAADRRGVIVDALDLSIDDLRLDPDARRAIIAAYARMERAFMAAGLPRQPSEAPHEFLARSLRELHTSADAATTLTELFELAKFSDHPLDLGMRDEALEAFLRLRSELAKPAKASNSASESVESFAPRSRASV